MISCILQCIIQFEIQYIIQVGNKSIIKSMHDTVTVQLPFMDSRSPKLIPTVGPVRNSFKDVLHIRRSYEYI